RMAENGGVLENAMQRMLRAMYLMVRGEWEPAQEALREFERHSAEVGDIWQLEDTIVPFGVLTASAAGDTVALKRAMTQLRVISKKVASMVLIERLARSLYLAHHGRATDVVAELEEVARRTPPLSEMLWMDIHTDLAFAYLSVGKLERAAAVCRETLASARGEMRFTDIGIAFTHWVWSEAELGLGRPAEALKILEALFVEIEPTGAPLLLGRSHGLRALAKRALGDLEGCSRDLAQMRMYYARSGHPALVASSERFGADPSEVLLQSHSSNPPRGAELPQTMKR
ncbi:MAG TPA: hypothetical protein VHM19_11160, partial [Polyangiales bacterium]|nr:hypothetical protein [Polyangiales bacterium]